MVIESKAMLCKDWNLWLTWYVIRVQRKILSLYSEVVEEHFLKEGLHVGPKEKEEIFQMALVPGMTTQEAWISTASAKGTEGKGTSLTSKVTTSCIADLKESDIRNESRIIQSTGEGDRGVPTSFSVSLPQSVAIGYLDLLISDYPCLPIKDKAILILF